MDDDAVVDVLVDTLGRPVLAFAARCASVCAGRPERRGMLYEQSCPRFMQRLHSGFSLLHLIFEVAQLSQLLLSVVGAEALRVSVAAAGVCDMLDDSAGAGFALVSVDMARRQVPAVARESRRDTKERWIKPLKQRYAG